MSTADGNRYIPLLNQKTTAPVHKFTKQVSSFVFFPENLLKLNIENSAKLHALGRLQTSSSDD